jgi:hypothetical protein
VTARIAPSAASEALLAAVRGLRPELLADPGRLSVVAEALVDLTDVLVAVAAAGKLSDETLRALAALDAGTSRLAAALRDERDDGAARRQRRP